MPKYKVKLPTVRREEPKEPMIFLESYYYGIYETGTENDSAIAVDFEADVSREFFHFFSGSIYLQSIRSQL